MAGGKATHAHDGGSDGCVKLFGEDISVRAELAAIDGISGHADREGLAAWLSGFRQKPKRVFINHGDSEVCDLFASYLRTEFGYETAAPYSGTVYDLISGACLVQTEGIPVQKKESEGTSIFKSVLAAAERLLELVRGLKGRPNKDLKKLNGEIDKLISKYQ